MRIAVFSDVHGNPYACQAVLQAIAKAEPCEAIVAAGDLCLGGSDPAACIDLLMAAGALGVYGNTETYIFAPGQTPRDEAHRAKWPYIQPVAQWVKSQLSPAQQAWLEALPFEQRFSPDGQPSHDLLVVHANPIDVEYMIYPPLDDQLKLWGRIRQPDDDPSLNEALERVSAEKIAFGHFHYVSQRTWNGIGLVNVASVSLPGVDHDRRARFSFFTWTGAQWEVDHHWVDYGAEREIAAIQTGDMPSKAFFISYFG